MLNLEKIYNDFVSWLVVTVFGGLAAWVVALRRKVNTNEAQIMQDRAEHQRQVDLIIQRLDSRDKQREDDRGAVEDLGTDVRELRQDVRDIKNALIGKK